MKKSTRVPTIEMLSESARKRIKAIGNDVGDRFVHYCAMDAKGAVVAEGKVTTSVSAISALYSGLPGCVMVMETGPHSPWMYRLLTSLGHETIVANARKLDAIFRSSRKSDKRDAQTLAKLALFDRAMLYPVHQISERSQQHMGILRSRDALVRSRTRLISYIRSTVKATGNRLPKCSADAFAGKVLPLLPEPLSHTLGPIVMQIAEHTRQIRAYTNQIEQLIESEYPQAKQLMQIKGVGPLTALAYVLRIEDPTRFADSRKVGAYFGLVSRLDQSGNQDPQLRISREGDVLVRRLLVSASHYILGHFGQDSELRRAGMRIIERGGRHARKRAVIAVARKLAVLLHRLWISGAAYEPFFQEKRNQQPVALTA